LHHCQQQWLCLLQLRLQLLRLLLLFRLLQLPLQLLSAKSMGRWDRSSRFDLLSIFCRDAVRINASDPDSQLANRLVNKLFSLVSACFCARFVHGIGNMLSAGLRNLAQTSDHCTRLRCPREVQ